MSDRLTGVLEKIIWTNEETHWTIAEICCDADAVFGGNAVVKGTLPGVQCGETLELEGEWVEDGKFGRQFAVKSFRSKLPASVHGIRKYLGSKFVEGIGKIYANRIVDRFGADTLRIISEEAGRLREVKGISDHRVHIIHQAWERHRRLHAVFSEMQTYGINIGQCAKILEKYGDDPMKTVRENPYRLARDIRGIAFPTADKIAKNLGLGNENPHRLRAGVFYTFEEFEGEGNTAVPAEALLKKAVEKLDVPETLVAQIVAELEADGRLVVPAGTPQKLYQRESLARAEREIAEALAEIRSRESCLPPIKTDAAAAWAQDRAGFAFAPGQTAAVKTALREKFSIITGGPGTGKTTILSALCAILKAKKVRIFLAAPTGRAAQRMKEATGVPAQTIHRMLNIGAETAQSAAEEEVVGRELSFAGNSGNGGTREFLKAEFVIIDEASMLDARLAAKLLKKIEPAAHVVFVGDANQLPSVGPGNVLGDLIDSRRVPVTVLEAVFRQGSRSGIVTTAHNVLRGITIPPPKVEAFCEIDCSRDIFFFPCETAGETLQKTIRLATKVIPRLFPCDPVNDIQILTPMHKGEVGVQALNAFLQKAFKGLDAPSGVPAGTLRPERGDKVIQTRNNYEKNVFNGDMGIVSETDGGSGAVTVDFDREKVAYTKSEVQSELSLAYAVTIHKSQGSEFPFVIVPFVKSQFMMLRRNLIYTAITRGRKKVFIVGQPGAYFLAVKNALAEKRITTLRERLAEI